MPFWCSVDLYGVGCGHCALWKEVRENTGCGMDFFTSLSVVGACWLCWRGHSGNYCMRIGVYTELALWLPLSPSLLPSLPLILSLSLVCAVCECPARGWGQYWQAWHQRKHATPQLCHQWQSNISQAPSCSEFTGTFLTSGCKSPITPSVLTAEESKPECKGLQGEYPITSCCKVDLRCTCLLQSTR